MTRTTTELRPDNGDRHFHEQVESLAVTPTPDAIAKLAFRIYDESGRQDGHDVEDWLEAERCLSAPQTT